METRIIIQKSEILKEKIAVYFNLNKLFVKISEPIFNGYSYSENIEISFEIPENDLRKFVVRTYSFSIDNISDHNFKFENSYYNYDNLEPFLNVISKEIDDL